jgi:hypothetical protein
MIDAHPAGSTGGAARDDASTAAAHGAAGWLCLAATPTFAAMALLTGVRGGGPMDVLCAAGHGSPLDGMAPMHLLMGAFHSSPWLKVIAGRRRVSTGHDRAAAGGAR